MRWWSRTTAVREQLLAVKHSIHRRFRRDVDAPHLPASAQFAAGNCYESARS